MDELGEVDKIKEGVGDRKNHIVMDFCLGCTAFIRGECVSEDCKLRKNRRKG